MTFIKSCSYIAYIAYIAIVELPIFPGILGVQSDASFGFSWNSVFWVAVSMSLLQLKNTSYSAF